ncbi:hypothetical protein ACT2FY_39340 [Paraburkholderia fungorum]|uniref:hypothetical protein n=2 Tax=Paraburkholderia fungorum TaxID=134537 RepID=UPI00402B79BF
MSRRWPKNQNSIHRPGLKAGDQEVAVLAMEEAEYNELLRNAKPCALHSSWLDYCAWIDGCIQKGLDRGRPVKVYQGTAVRVSAFMWVSKRELETATLLAYALHLLCMEPGVA